MLAWRPAQVSRHHSGEQQNSEHLDVGGAHGWCWGLLGPQKCAGPWGSIGLAGAGCGTEVLQQVD
eukprot:10427136-Lingulodinium_polyedra.AAC.1